MIQKITPQGAQGYCEFCGKWCERLDHLALTERDAWVCQECGKQTMDRIRHRYRVAGEHTEPAE